MSLLQLPDELLCYISEYLQTEREASSLARVNTRLYHVTIPFLYRLNAQQSNSSALLWAAENGNLDTAQRALKVYRDDSKAKMSSYDYAQSTPPIHAALVLAAEHNHPALLRFLIAQGAHPNRGDRNRHRNSLEVAAEQGHTAIVELLLDLDADATAGFGRKPFAIQVAAMQGHVDIVRLLIDAGENPDRNNGRPAGGAYTPLQAAALTGNEEMATLLLDRGAEVDNRSAKGDSPLEIAVLGKKLGVARVLVGAGAKVYKRHSRYVRRPAREWAGKPGWEAFWELLKDEDLHTWAER